MSQEHDELEEYGNADYGEASTFVRETEIKFPSVAGQPSRTVLRIRPPAKCLTGDPDRMIRSKRWAFGHRIHWDMTNPPGAAKPVWRAYLCPEELDWDRKINGRPTVLVPCDSCVRRNEIHAQHAQTSEQLKAIKASPEERKQVLGPLNAYMRAHTFDNRFRFHVYDIAKGVAGRGRLAPSFFKGKYDRSTGEFVGGLLNFLKQIGQERGFHPVGAKDGCAIVFKRSGSDLSTTFEFSEARGEDDKLLRGPLTPQMLGAFKSGCVQDLDDPAPAVSLTADQVREYNVLLESGDYEKIDAMFKAARKSKGEPSTVVVAPPGPGIVVSSARPADTLDSLDRTFTAPASGSSLRDMVGTAARPAATPGDTSLVTAAAAADTSTPEPMATGTAAPATSPAPAAIRPELLDLIKKLKNKTS